MKLTISIEADAKDVQALLANMPLIKQDIQKLIERRGNFSVRKTPLIEVKEVDYPTLKF